MAAIAAVAPWSMIGANGAARTLAAMRMVKMQRVKPTVDTIVKAGNVEDQATLIRAVVNHSALAAARALAGLLSTKEQAAASYVSKQTARILGRARSNVKVRGNRREKNAMPPRLSWRFQHHCPPVVNQPTGKQSFQASVIALGY